MAVFYTKDGGGDQPKNDAQQSRERTRETQIASLAAEMNAAQPPRRRRRTKPKA